MQRAEWLAIVDKLNASWPDAALTDQTAKQWFEELERYDAASAWLAARRCRRERRRLPSLADLFDAIDQNDQEDRERQRLADKIVPPGTSRRQGRPMPPETRRAVEILKGRLTTDPDDLGDVDGHTAASMIAGLADRLEARLRDRRQPETAADATRTCPECATSPIAGWVVVVEVSAELVAQWLPCPTCRSSRHDAVLAGVADHPCDEQGRPKGWDRKRGG